MTRVGTIALRGNGALRISRDPSGRAVIEVVKDGGTYARIALPRPLVKRLTAMLDAADLPPHAEAAQ